MADTERISKMESILDAVSESVREFSGAAERYAALQEDYSKLLDYYGSEEWFSDLEDDEAGKLPPDLKRGVLSEDAVYDLITEQKQLIAKLLRIAADDIDV